MFFMLAGIEDLDVEFPSRADKLVHGNPAQTSTPQRNWFRLGNMGNPPTGRPVASGLIDNQPPDELFSIALFHILTLHLCRLPTTPIPTHQPVESLCRSGKLVWLPVAMAVEAKPLVYKKDFSRSRSWCRAR